MKAQLQSIALVALSAATIVGIAHAQTEPRFEVSPAIGAGAGPGAARNPQRVSRTPERIAFQSALVGNMMAFAYGFPLDRIERLPQWMYDARYDVAVTTEAATSLAEQKQLLQKLLEDRFGLVVHRVSYPSLVYFLVRGPDVKLTPTQDGDTANIPEFRREPFRPDTFQPSPIRDVYAARHVSISDLASWLYLQVQLPVIDKTGITGFFDIEISGLPIRGGAEGTIQAVRNSLGLDLESGHGTAESLIIEHIEQPSRN